MHLSDVSWEEDEESVRLLERGQEIETIILSIDSERERISLGIKQLKEDIFNEFFSSNKKGSRVMGKVVSFTDQKITLNLSEGIEGTLAQKDFINSSLDVPLVEGLEIEVVVAKIDNKNREIILSLRALEKAEERSALKENILRNKEIEESSKSNIGDLIKAEIGENKDE